MRPSPTVFLVLTILVRIVGHVLDSSAHRVEFILTFLPVSQQQLLHTDHTLCRLFTFFFIKAIRVPGVVADSLKEIGEIAKKTPDLDSLLQDLKKVIEAHKIFG